MTDKDVLLLGQVTGFLSSIGDILDKYGEKELAKTAKELSFQLLQYSYKEMRAIERWENEGGNG